VALPLSPRRQTGTHWILWVHLIHQNAVFPLLFRPLSFSAVAADADEAGDVVFLNKMAEIKPRGVAG
jgi:hypothetical protein